MPLFKGHHSPCAHTHETPTFQTKALGLVNNVRIVLKTTFATTYLKGNTLHNYIVSLFVCRWQCISSLRLVTLQALYQWHRHNLKLKKQQTLFNQSCYVRRSKACHYVVIYGIADGHCQVVSGPRCKWSGWTKHSNTKGPLDKVQLP